MNLHIRSITILASLAACLALGACAAGSVDEAAVSAKLPPIHDPAKFCLGTVGAQNVSDLSGEREVRYVACAADPDPFLWNYEDPSPAALRQILAGQHRVEAVARAVVDANR